jgi:predicted small secreted protein
MEETVPRLRAISVLFLLLAAGALTTACETTRSGGSGDDYRFVNSRRDP